MRSARKATRKLAHSKGRQDADKKNRRDENDYNPFFHGKIATRYVVESFRAQPYISKIIYPRAFSIANRRLPVRNLPVLFISKSSMHR